MPNIRAIQFRPPSPLEPDEGLNQPFIDVADLAVTGTPGDTVTNDITWEDADIDERGPIQDITASFGSVINISDKAISPGTATWQAVNVQEGDDQQVYLEIIDADGLIDSVVFSLNVAVVGGPPTVLFFLDPETGNTGEWSAYLPLSSGVALTGSWSDPDADAGTPMQDWMRVEIDGVDRTADGTPSVSNRDQPAGSWSWYSTAVDLLDDEKDIVVTLRDFAGQEGSTPPTTLKFRTDDILRSLPTHVSPKASLWSFLDPQPDLAWDKTNGGTTWVQDSSPFPMGLVIPAEGFTMNHVCAEDGHYRCQLGIRTHDVDNWMVCRVEVRVNGDAIVDYVSGGSNGDRATQDEVTDTPLDHDLKAGDVVDIKLTGHHVLVPENPTDADLPWLEWSHFSITPTEGPPTGSLVFHWEAGEV